MDSYRTRFKSPWDMLLIIMTSVIVALLLWINSIVGMISIIFLNLAIIGVCAAMGVYGYSIQDHELRILRLGWSKNIALEDISDVEYMPTVMMGSVRLFGIGGLFSYMGNFKNGILNHYKAYVTHREKTVLITMEDGKQILISPDDPVEFVSSLRFYIEEEESIVE